VEYDTIILAILHIILGVVKKLFVNLDNALQEHKKKSSKEKNNIGREQG
jgi:hypothetical protein